VGLGTFVKNTSGLLANLWRANIPTTNSEQRNYQEVAFDYLKSMLTGGASSSGEIVSPNSAMRVATVFTCLRIKSDALAQLPCNVIKHDGDQFTVDYNHPAYKLVHIRPNAWQTPFQFWKLVEQTIELEGDCFIGIKRTPKMVPTEFLYLLHEDVKVMETPEGFPVYTYKGNPLNYFDVLHFKTYSRNGKLGISTIEQNADTIGNAITLRKYSNRTLSTTPPVYATSNLTQFPKTEGKAQFQEYLAQQMDNWYARGEMPFFTHGFELKGIGLKPTDAAYLDQISATKEDIYGIFGVPPGIGGSFKTGVTYSNLEQQNLQFLIYSLNPVIVNIEQELNYKLFIGEESNTHYCKFNEKALLRTDALTQMQLIQGYFKIGVYSRNEIRQMLDMNPVEDGDEYYIEGNNMVSTDSVSDMEEEPDDDEIEDDPVDIQRKKVGHKPQLNGHAN
jgi:HK97 family phage portal protein